MVTAAPGIADTLKRNDKLPSGDQLKVSKVHVDRDDEFHTDPMIEVEGIIDAVNLLGAVGYLQTALTDVADPQGFLDLELEAI